MYFNYRFHFVVFHHDGSVVSYLVPMQAAPKHGYYEFPPEASLHARARRCLDVLGAAAVVVVKRLARSVRVVAAYRGGSDGGALFVAGSRCLNPVGGVERMCAFAVDFSARPCGVPVRVGGGVSDFVAALPAFAWSSLSPAFAGMLFGGCAGVPVAPAAAGAPAVAPAVAAAPAVAPVWCSSRSLSSPLLFS